LGHAKKNVERADCYDITDLDLNMNTTNYINNNKYRDAAEIILHFINVK